MWSLRPRGRSWVFAPLLALASACHAPATVVVFVLGSDAPTERDARVIVRVSRADMQPSMIATPLGRAVLTREGEELFSIVPNGEPRSQRVEVVLQATLAATATEPTQVIRRALRFAFVPNIRLVQRVFFSMACLNRSTDCRAPNATCTVQDACEERGLTCGDNGECVAVNVTPMVDTDASVRFDSAVRVDVAARPDATVMDVPPRLDATEMDVARDTFDPCADAAVGASCTPATACRTGARRCNAGVVTCEPLAMAPVGAPCGAGRVCDLAGDCVACAAGMACTAADPCRNGSIVCSSGEAMCVAGSLKPAGTTCGTNRVCSAAGSCTACTAGASCTGSNACVTATIACNTGAPVCVDRGPAPNGTPCGTQRECSSGACVCAASGGCGTNEVCVRNTCANGALVPMYTCPNFGGGSLGGGSWGFYGCTGQTWSVPTCNTIESPRNRTDSCVSAGRLQLTQSPVAPSGSTAVPLYRCPSLGGGSLGGGDWGYYECQGQLSSNSACTTIESPRNSSTPCPSAGYLTVFAAAPSAPAGGRVMAIYRCPSLGPGSLGGGSWGYYGCRGQLTTASHCDTIEYPTNRSSACPSAGFIVLE